MRYEHIKTGAIIDSSSKIIGKAWRIVDESDNKDEYVEEEIDLEAMTNQELDNFAKEHEIELSADDKKNKTTRINAIAKAFE